MSAPQLASCVGFRGHALGVAERVTCWTVTRDGRVGSVVLIEGADGHLECVWRGFINFHVVDLADGLDVVCDLGCL